VHTSPSETRRLIKSLVDANATDLRARLVNQQQEINRL
jgi:hypothetical protein